MPPLPEPNAAGIGPAISTSWVDDFVRNNTSTLHQHTQSAFDIYMASARPGTGMIAGIQYWQVANGYTAMALHDLWGGFTDNKATLHHNLINVMDSVGHDGTPDGEGDGGASRGKGFVNVFNDDSMWWALAALEGWRLTSEDRLISAARHVWKVVSDYVLPPGTMVGNVDMSGGVIWTARENEGSVNAITTGLYAELAARLAPYEAAGSERRVRYLQAAHEALGWILRTRYDEKEHVIMDTIDCKTGERHDWTFTYNTGQTIAAAVAMYQALKEAPELYTVAGTNTTDDNKDATATPTPIWSPSRSPYTILDPSQYLQLALRLALPALTRPQWVDPDGTLTERTAYPGTGAHPLPATQNNDAVGFKAVLLRALVKLYRALREAGIERDAQTAIRRFVQTQFVSVMWRARDFGGEGDTVWDPPMQFGPWWAGPWDTPTSHSQMAALDVVSALWGVVKKERGPE